LHVVVDNYATHKHQRVQAWLGSHPRIQLHFTPTDASWLNLVEVFFAIIERQALRRGDFASVEELVTAIRRFVTGWNQRCQPFIWTKTPTRSSPSSTWILLKRVLCVVRRLVVRAVRRLCTGASRPNGGVNVGRRP
jgi:hypothetical protein